jgi:nucleotide-binding universal stress UspA family protein
MGNFMSDAAPIVVGTDGSPGATRAVSRAAEIAKALDAPLHVVTCFSSVPTGAIASASLGMGTVAADDPAAEPHAAEVVSRAASTIDQTGVVIETHICEGEAADALITVAIGIGAQMIVVGNRGMAGARRMLGSVPNRVSHRAPCAVLIVPTAA